MIRSRTRRPAAIPSVISDPEPARLPRLKQGRHKQPQDTEQGCRALAAADLACAGASGEGWPRVRMERSAAAWTSRANLLHRLEAKANAALRSADAAAPRH
jgi:hypothetical protein